MEKLTNRVLSLVEQYAQEQLDFLVRLCNLNSFSYNKEGVDRAARMIADSLAGILPVHEVRKQQKLGDHHLLKSTNWAEGKAIYLVGHIDTVFPPDHPFQQCRMSGDLLNGPGSGDMKGGIVVMIYALKILRLIKQELDLPGKLRLVMLLNSDEELGSISSREIFLAEREKASLCLTGECAGLNNEIVVSRNGKMGARITCFGQGRHVGCGSANKSSAILELAHKIIQLEGINGSLPGVDLNVGQVEGGLGSNTVPEKAACELDLRWRQEEQYTAALEKINGIVSIVDQPGCRSQLEILNQRPTLPETSGSLAMMGRVEEIARRLGQEIGTEHRRGTSDANFFGSVGVPTLDGWGPVCAKDHTAEEYIKISSLQERTALLALFLLELLQ